MAALAVYPHISASSQDHQWRWIEIYSVKSPPPDEATFTGLRDKGLNIYLRTLKPTWKSSHVWFGLCPLTQTHPSPAKPRMFWSKSFRVPSLFQYSSCHVCTSPGHSCEDFHYLEIFSDMKGYCPFSCYSHNWHHHRRWQRSTPGQVIGQRALHRERGKES